MAAALLFMVVGCDPAADLPVLQSNGVSNGYKLSTGDELRVTTFNETSLSGSFGIDDSGYVALPLLGPVQADGLTTQGLATRIASELRDKKLLSDPSVVVEVVKYRPVFVLGEVQHPGPFPYQPHMTMLSAVALAGGFTPRAVKHRAEVARIEGSSRLRGGLDPDSNVEPGDIITVLERNF